MRLRFLFLGMFCVIIIGSLIHSQVQLYITGDSITGAIKDSVPDHLFDITFSLEDRVILNSDDLVSLTTFESFGTKPTPVNLTFIIFDSRNKIVYKSEEFLVVETENILRKDFKDLNLDFGEYQIYLKTVYGEGVEDFFERNFEIRSKISNSPNQLFDIKFDLDSRSISQTQKLFTRVILESFGSEPTPVELNFRILNSYGEEIYKSEDNTVVETEQIFRRSFDVSNFPEGDYKIVLTTFYNDDVEDEFIRDFRISNFKFSLWMLWVSIFLNLILLFFIVRFYKREWGDKNG